MFVGVISTGVEVGEGVIVGVGVTEIPQGSLKHVEMKVAFTSPFGGPINNGSNG